MFLRPQQQDAIMLRGDKRCRLLDQHGVCCPCRREELKGATKKILESVRNKPRPKKKRQRRHDEVSSARRHRARSNPLRNARLTPRDRTCTGTRATYVLGWRIMGKPSTQNNSHKNTARATTAKTSHLHLTSVKEKTTDRASNKKKGCKKVNCWYYIFSIMWLSDLHLRRRIKAELYAQGTQHPGHAQLVVANASRV